LPVERLTMLKISEFSRLSQVTVKTLHYYDKIGLLKPVHIEGPTGYRFYSVDQLARIHRIMALKELGLSLEQVGLIVDRDLSVEQIRGMLRLKQIEIQEQINSEQKRLSLVEFRLRMIEAETNFPELDVVIKRLDAMKVLSMLVGERHQMAKVVKEIRNAIESGEIKYAGIAMDVLYGGEYGHEISIPDASHEIIFAVEDGQSNDVRLESQGMLKLRSEPAIDTAATLIIEGGEQTARHEKVLLLQRWAVAHGYKLGNRVRVFHPRGPLETLDRSGWVSELQLALEPN
jgi:DNA-binding transcriptional MerR regulator